MTARNNDLQGRYRNKIISFRASSEEAKLIDEMVKLSGINKQDYLIQATTNNTIVVSSNPYLYRQLRDKLVSFTEEFKQLEKISELSLDELEILERMLEVIKGLKENKKAQYIVEKTGAPGK